MRNKKLVYILIFWLLFLIVACGGNRQTHYTGVVDLSWVGIWKGNALIVSEKEPPKPMELEIEHSGKGFKAFLTDSTQRLVRYPIRDLVFEKESIIFKASYESYRGLQRNVVFRGIKLGPYLKIEFSGSEGGRAFRGKWQAKHFRSPTTKPPTSPSDTTSTTSF